MRSIRHNSTHRCRGAAMSEMVLSIPMLAFILLLLLYFGRGIVRVQRTQVMDRYEAWRIPNPAEQPLFGGDVGDNDRLNKAFFAGNAQTIGRGIGDNYPVDAREQLLARLAQLSQDADRLATQMFNDLPWGVTARVSSEHVGDVKLLQAMDGPIRHAHTRMHNDWQFVNGFTLNDDDVWEPTWPKVSIMPTTRTVFYPTFDEGLESIEASDNPLAGMIRDLYLHEPAYEGPTINEYSRDD